MSSLDPQQYLFLKKLIKNGPVKSDSLCDSEKEDCLYLLQMKYIVPIKNRVLTNTVDGYQRHLPKLLRIKLHLPVELKRIILNLLFINGGFPLSYLLQQ